MKGEFKLAAGKWSNKQSRQTGRRSEMHGSSVHRRSPAPVRAAGSSESDRQEQTPAGSKYRASGTSSQTIYLAFFNIGELCTLENITISG